MSDLIKYPEFGRRLEMACASNPQIPPFRQGRNKWFADQLARRYGDDVSEETIRKWFNGETFPRKPRMKALAQLTGVSEGWLASGEDDRTDKARTLSRVLAANGAVSIVAGLITLDGGAVTLISGDARKDNPNDLLAIIQQKAYQIHVTVADDRGLFAIPAEDPKGVILGVEVTGSFDIKIVKIDWATAVKSAKRAGVELFVAVDSDWGRIESFCNGI